MKNYKTVMSRPWTFFIINCVFLLVVLVMHPYFIATYISAIKDSYVYIFLIIEIPLIIYCAFNIMFLSCVSMEQYLRKLLKYRYFMIDLIIIPILGGLAACIYKYVQAKDAVDNPTSITYS